MTTNDAPLSAVSATTRGGRAILRHRYGWWQARGTASVTVPVHRFGTSSTTSAPRAERICTSEGASR